MKTPEEYMTQFAQEHSHESCSDLMYDSHDIFQIEYTKELLLIYAKDLIEECAKIAVYRKGEKVKQK